MENSEWLVIVAVLGLLGCAQQPVPAAGTAGSPAVTWTAEVDPIVKARCIECHVGDTAPAGLSLDSWSATWATGVSSACSGLTIAQAMAAKVSAEWSARCIGSQMPLIGDSLSVDDQQKIRDWAEAGAPE